MQSTIVYFTILCRLMFLQFCLRVYFTISHALLCVGVRAVLSIYYTSTCISFHDVLAFYIAYGSSVSCQYFAFRISAAMCWLSTA